MLNATDDGRVSEPLTHQRYLRACGALIAAGRPDLRPWVQIRKRFNGRPEVLCGQVVELNAEDDAGQWMKVRTDIGYVRVESRNVRLCSGDGRCTCEPADAPVLAGRCAEEVSRAGHRYPARDGLIGDQADAKDSHRAGVCKNMPAEEAAAC